MEARSPRPAARLPVVTSAVEPVRSLRIDVAAIPEELADPIPEPPQGAPVPADGPSWYQWTDERYEAERAASE